jgi:hypothetical protein
MQVLVCVLVAGAMAASSAQQPASVDHVRAALEKPPSVLVLANRTADFTVHIEERHPLHEIFDRPPWATDPVGWQPPGLGFDLLSVVRYLGKGAADAKRAHDTRVARDEVQRAIGDYCAAQPDAVMIRICSTSPAIR